MSWDPFIIDMGTAAVGISAFLLSIWFNWQDWRDEK
jgi:hypothetical protein